MAARAGLRRFRDLAVLGVVVMVGVRLVTAQAPPTGSLHGVVVNVDGLLPIALAEIHVDGTDIRAVTGEDGEFRIDGIPVASYTLVVRRIGFDPVVLDNYAIRPGVDHRVEFAMRGRPVSLDQIDVTAAEHDRRDETRNSSILRDEDLPEQGDILNALQGRIPGLRLTGRNDDVRVRLRGGVAEPMFVIDGTVATPPLRFFIPVSDVECVEVRRGRQAAMEYRSSAKTDQYNGVILIWTKPFAARMRGACALG